MEILHLVGLTKWGDKIHDATYPIREEEDQSLTAIEAVVIDDLEEIQPKPQSEVSIEHHETIRLFSEWCQCMGVEIPFDWQKHPHQINEQMQDLVVEYKTMAERGTIMEARQAFKDSISL
jgi:hypothetical protein